MPPDDDHAVHVSLRASLWRDQPGNAPLSAPDESAGRGVAASGDRTNPDNGSYKPGGSDQDTPADDDWPGYDYWPRDHNGSGHDRWRYRHGRAAALNELAAGRLATGGGVGEGRKAKSQGGREKQGAHRCLRICLRRPWLGIGPGTGRDS